MIYPAATALSAVWAVVALSVGLSAGGVFTNGFSLSSPGLLNLAILLFVPIGFIWAIASTIWRTQELRIVARSITDVAARLSEPETIATDAVANVSQAIRREVAAVGTASNGPSPVPASSNCSCTTKSRRSNGPIGTTKRACAPLSTTLPVSAKRSSSTPSACAPRLSARRSRCPRTFASPASRLPRT